MNNDLNQLLHLRAHMSWLFSFTDLKKREIASLEKEREKKQEKAKEVRREELEKYQKSRKLIPSAQQHKCTADRLRRQLDNVKETPSILDCISIFYREIVMYILAGVGAVGGAVFFCLICNKWMHMDTWINVKGWLFLILGYAIKYGLYGIMFVLFAIVGAVGLVFAYAALVMIGVLIFQSILLPRRFERRKLKKQIKHHEYYVYHSVGNVYLDALPDQPMETARVKAIKEKCDERIALADNEVKLVEKKIVKCATEIEDAHNAFHHTKFIILEKDYKYLDYLIYLIVSHRANTVTEAFRELEMQLRHNELMNRLDYLEGTITKSISSLSREIEENTVRIQNLETTFTQQSNYTQELIREGNRISSQRYDELVQVNKYLKSLDSKIPFGPYRYIR